MFRERVLVATAREAAALDSSNRMTIDGTLTRVSILLLVAVACAAFTYNEVMPEDPLLGFNPAARTWSMAGGLIGLVLCLVISFKPRLAPVLAVPFAAAEGLLLGAISAIYAVAFAPGIIIQAVLLTFGISLSMFGLWRSGLVQVTNKFRTVVCAAMGAIFLTYMVSWIMSMFGGTIPLIHSNGLIGIGFSAIVIVVVSLMLMIDFDMIARSAKAGAPKYMEWYGAFALLVTLVWLYLELLRLLSKLHSRN